MTHDAADSCFYPLNCIIMIFNYLITLGLYAMDNA